LSSYSGSLGTLKPVAKLKVSIAVSAKPTAGAIPSYRFSGKPLMVPSAISCTAPNAPSLGTNPSSPGAMYPPVEGSCTCSGWVGVSVGTSEPDCTFVPKLSIVDCISSKEILERSISSII